MGLGSAAALAAGLAHAFAFAPTDAWWAQLALLGLLVWLTRDARPARAAWMGWLFGLGWFGAGVSWVYVSMHDYGGMPAVMAGAATLGFAAYLAVFPAAAMAATAALAGPAGPRSTGHHALHSAAVFAAAWTMTELARGWLFTGFPWLAVGYAHTDGPLAGLAPVVGVYGTGAAAALVAAALAQAAAALRQRYRAPAAAGAGGGAAAIAPPLAAAVLALLAGAALDRVEWTRPHGEPLSIRLVQGNVPQELKFDPGRERVAMQRYVEHIEASPAALTILPETAWTAPWNATPSDLAARVAARLRGGGAVAIGMPLAKAAPGEPSGGAESRRARRQITNSVLVMHGDSAGGLAALGRYDKQHLVPFGEFVPLGFRWFVELMRIPLGDFGRGDRLQAPIAVGDQRLAFNICYEDLFGEELIGPVAQAGATVLVNVSNIAWFGDSLALPQHLQIARMRAIETGRAMLRATNTGMTAAIDARGRVLARLAPMTEGVLDAALPGRTGLTPYVRTGNAPTLLACVALLGAAAVRARGAARRTGIRTA